MKNYIYLLLTLAFCNQLISAPTPKPTPMPGPKMLPALQNAPSNVGKQQSIMRKYSRTYLLSLNPKERK
jgi:hypothetical protein